MHARANKTVNFKPDMRFLGGKTAAEITLKDFEEMTIPQRISLEQIYPEVYADLISREQAAERARFAI